MKYCPMQLPMPRLPECSITQKAFAFVEAKLDEMVEAARSRKR